MTYSEFFSTLGRLRSETAQFYLADLHVHTHDSAGDFPSSQELSPEELQKSLTEAEKRFRAGGAAISCEEYLQSFDGLCPKIQIIAITDHDVCDVACQLATRTSNSRLILPGIEIRAKVSPISATDAIHLLCVFDPSKNSQTIWHHVAPSSDLVYRDPVEQPLDIRNLPDFIRNHVHANNGICIAAHVDQENGLRKYFFDTASQTYIQLQAKRKSFEKARDELLAVLARGADPVAKQGLAEVEARLKQLEDAIRQVRQQLAEKQNQLQENFLCLIADCIFDALQVQKESDGQHYQGEHTRALGLFPMAVIMSSDAHHIAAVGKKATWLKMAGLSFDGLRRALEFPVCRVRLGDYEKPRYPKILGLRFVPDKEAKPFFQKTASGFPTVAFADNLNCLVGGRGSGKSAIIDAIKLLFKGIPEEERDLANSIRDISDQKHIRQLPDWMQRLVATMYGSEIQVAFQYDHPATEGEKFALTLPFSFRFDSSATVYSPDGQDTGLLATNPRFEVDVYGWSEIEALGSSQEAQRALIDKFAHAQQFHGKIQDALSSIVENRRQICLLAEEAELLAQTKELIEYSSREKELAFYNRPEIAEAFEETDILESRQTRLKTFATAVSNLASQIKELDIVGSVRKACDEFLTQAQDSSPPKENADGDSPTQTVSNPEPNEQTPAPTGDPWVTATGASMGIGDKAKIERINSAVQTLLAEIDSYSQGADGEIQSLTKALKEKLAAIMTAAEGTDAVAKGRRHLARERFADSEKKLAELKAMLARISAFLIERDKLKLPLVEGCQQRTAARKEIVDKINERLKTDVNSPRIEIRIVLKENFDRTSLEALLNTMLKRTDKHIHHKAVKAALLALALDPKRIRDVLMGSGAIDALVLERDRMEEKVTETQAQAIFSECTPIETLALHEDGSGSLSYYDSEKLDEVLSLDELVFDDSPDIQLKVNPAAGGKFTSIAQLSPGQRCSALLPIILLRGNCPLVIDQPEDNLDNRLVCDVVIDVLQRLKEQRQIIVATHNPNIPVSGDAEQIIVTQALSRDEGTIAQQGPIDDNDIVFHVKDIMEGGEEAFRLRARRYNYDIQPRQRLNS